MRKILICSLMLFSLFVYSNDEKPIVCFSQGECQKLMGTTLGIRCMIVKTGLDYMGQLTCALRCYLLPMGSYCKPLENKQHGICEKESYDIPQFDFGNWDCSNAIDPDLLNYLYVNDHN